jgi:hypothetical protein
MTATIEIGRVRGFVLDDPVAGVLDNIEYPLGGLSFVDVTDKVRSVSVTRGKNRDLERFSAGTLEVSLNNQTRYFDPFSSSELDPIPRVPVRFSYGGTAQFYGQVEDWNYSYNPGGVSYAEISAVDDFTKLARTNILASGSATPQFSGERVTEVLDMFTVDWPGDKRNIDTGDTFLCTDQYEGENALEYLQLIDASEQGQLFIGKEGDLVFRSRGDATPTSDGLLTFADDGSGIDYKRVLVNYGSELMVNRATITAPLGTAIADNQLSQITYGLISSEIATLCASSTTLQDLADYTVAKYANPEYRFEAILLDIRALPPAEVASVMNLEIGDVIEVIFTPNNIGSAIDQYAQIIGIEHEVSFDSHEVTIRLAGLTFTSLVLSDTEFGKLDTYTLGF